MPIIKRTPAGTIYSRTDSDRLCLYFRGRKVYTKLHNTRAGIVMAEEQLNRMWREEEGLGKPARPKRVTIGAAWAEFEADWFVGKEPKTIMYYRTAARQCLTMTAALTQIDLDGDMQRVKRNEHLVPASREIYLRALRTFARWAVKRGYLATAPDVRVKAPEKKIETFTNDELSSIIETARAYDKEFGALIELLAATGLRIHEALELRWEDLRGDTMALMSKDGKRRENVPITPTVRAILEAQKNGSKDVFRWQRGTVSRLHRNWMKVLSDAGVEHRGRGFHVLRKTRWSRVIAADVNPVVAARLMRCSIQTAMKHYIRIDMRDLEKAALAADAFPLASRWGLSKKAKASQTL